jgi:hypothetical protein
MQKLYIKSTTSTPEIHFSPDDNIFLIRGISSPEDVRTTYLPVIEWVNNFIAEVIEQEPNKYTVEDPLRFQTELTYFNSSSAKFLFDIYCELKRLSQSGIPVVIEWIHKTEDIDMKEAGVDISLLAGMEFSYIKKNK